MRDTVPCPSQIQQSSTRNTRMSLSHKEREQRKRQRDRGKIQADGKRMKKKEKKRTQERGKNPTKKPPKTLKGQKNQETFLSGTKLLGCLVQPIRRIWGILSQATTEAEGNGSTRVFLRTAHPTYIAMSAGFFYVFVCWREGVR